MRHDRVDGRASTYRSRSTHTLAPAEGAVLNCATCSMDIVLYMLNILLQTR